MTATDELRRMLDERGVKWWQSANALSCIFTRWYSPIFGDEVVAMENGEEGLVLFDHFMTPEQAIEATLGETPTSPPPTPPKQPPYDELIESLRRDWDIEASWDGLRRFWYIGLTDEGVRKRDEREATLGRGTTTRHGKFRTKYGRSVPCCECCGYGIGDTRWHFCPSCGAEVVE